MAEVPVRRLVLWLSLTPRLGNKGIGRILDRLALQGLSPEEFLRLPADRKREGFGLSASVAAALSRPLAALEETYGPTEEKLRTLGVEWVTRHDASYPACVAERHPDPPTVLYLFGNRALFDRPTLAALASRDATAEALQRLERIVEKWVLKPGVLVAGHDTTAYRRAAVVPLRWGSPRILVLDCGMFDALSEQLDREPFSTARLWRYRFDPQTDLVISAHRPGDHLLGVHNKARDWLIAAVAEELLFVEVREGGVMQEIGLHALSQGRKVSACEWPEYDSTNAGNLRLLEAGAKAVRV